jgi:hypothetical protein
MGAMDAIPIPPIHPTTSRLTSADRWDHIQARWGVRRGQHRVKPGLYALGQPGPQSPVFVTANYTLSFDALRSALAAVDAYILVLDTQGINVWCAAGEGTFGTAELVRRAEEARLAEVVRGRVLILPQLGAPGVNAHEVRRLTGFRVEYGPVRAADLPAYLKTHKATPEMRQVRFGLRERLELTPIELVHTLIPLAVATMAVYFLAGLLPGLAVAAAILAGAALFPPLLPWLPFHDFSAKGYVLGLIVALPFSLALFASSTGADIAPRLVIPLILLLALPPVTAFLALNFTGSTSYTSRSGVKREIFTYIPVMAVLFGLGVLLAVGVNLARFLGRG